MSGVWVKVHPDDAGGGAPGAAVIGGATGSVTESSFTENGQAYDVYEFTWVWRVGRVGAWSG